MQNESPPNAAKINFVEKPIKALSLAMKKHQVKLTSLKNNNSFGHST